MIRIIVRAKGTPDRVVEFEKPEITIGRSKNSDIYLADSRMSRHHCSIVIEGGEHFVVDKGSSNGTYLNMKKVDREKIRTQDVINTGRHSLFVEEIPENAAEYEKFAETSDKAGFAAKALTVTSDSIAQHTQIAVSVPHYVVEVVEGEQKGKVYSLASEKATMGRSNQNTIVVKDPLASNFHAELVPDGEYFSIHDLGSTNGTKLNGKKVVKAPLFSGCEILIGDVRIVFKNTGRPTPRDIEFAGKKTPHKRLEKLEEKNSRLSIAYIVIALVLTAAILGGFKYMKKNPTPSITLDIPQPSQDPSNLLKSNSSFEGAVAADATPEGWVFSEVDNSTNVFVDKQRANDGSQSLAIKNIGGSEGKVTFSAVSQRNGIAVTGGASYTASAMILTDNSIGFNALRVRAYSSQSPEAYAEYFTVPISRTHTEFVKSECQFTVPKWADSVLLSCVACGVRGSAWFDSLALSNLEQPVEGFQQELDINSSYKIVIDRFSNHWIENKEGIPVAIGSPYQFVSEGNDALQWSNFFSDEPVLEVMKEDESLRIKARLLDVFKNTTGDVTFSLSCKEGICSIAAVLPSGAERKVKKLTSTYSVRGDLFENSIRAAIEDKLISLENGEEYSGVQEIILGKGPRKLSFGLAFPGSLKVSGSKLLAFCISCEPKTTDGQVFYSLLASSNPIVLNQYIEGLLAEASDLLKTGDISEAKRIYSELLKDFPDSNIVKSDSDRGFAEIVKIEKELTEALAVLSEKLEKTVGNADVGQFEAVAEELKALCQKIKIRVPGTDLEKKAEDVLSKIVEAEKVLEGKLAGMKAQKLLDLAKSSVGEGKYVMAKAILDNLLREYPKASCIAEAKKLLAEVEKNLEKMKKAVSTWAEVMEEADKLVSKGDAKGAKKIVADFLKEYPNYLPAQEYLESLN